MAQAISNKVQSTNPFAGLLGLNPQPKAPASVFGGAVTSTPSMIAPKAPQVNMNLPKPQMVTGLVSQAGAPKPPQNQATIQQATPQNLAMQQQPQQQQMTTPSGIPITGNPATFGGVQQPQQTSRGLFPDVLSSLAQGSVQKNDALAQQAQKITQEYGRQIADVGGMGARSQAGLRTTGTTPVAQGRAAVAAQTTSAQQQALAQGAQMELQGVQQGLAAQGQTQSALSSAGGLAQPYPTAYGQTSFDPATGEFGGGGSLPAEVMQQYAQMAATGQYTSIPSFITSNPVLNAQLNVAAKALNPKYTPVGAIGASQVLGNIPALQSAHAAGEGIKNSITSYLASNPSLNPSDLAAGNLLQQWIQGKQLTDPKYQVLFNYLNEYTNTLAPILGVGGDPTNLKTQIAAGFINAAASGQSITQVLNAMSSLSENKINDMQSGALGGGTTVPNTASGSGGFAEAW